MFIGFRSFLLAVKSIMVHGCVATSSIAASRCVAVKGHIFLMECQLLCNIIVDLASGFRCVLSIWTIEDL